MRRRLMAAAAMAPLMIGYQAAHAQNPALTISSDTSTPVQTAKAVNGGPGDIVITGGTFTINTTTPAVTVNSDNNVINGGTITSNNVNNATGILITGNSGAVSNSVTNNGTINLTESYSPSDSANNDGITEAPYAQGTGRIGIRLTGPFTGTINNNGPITIQGNNSTGISIENKLSGDLLQNGGSVTLTGDNGYGIRTTGDITGKVQLQGGAIQVKGQGSVGVSTEGQIGGALSIYNTITTTGYAVTARETGSILTNIEKTPADVQQGGSAVQVKGNVLGGVFLGAPPAGTVSTDTTTDADGDGIVDSAEGTSAITTYGSAPALNIGGSAPITLGNFNPTVNPYGLVIEGTVSGQGLLDGVTATAVNIGGAGVNLNGGIHIAPTANVNADAFQASATAMHLGAGVTGQAINNEGVISAAVTSAGADTATGLVIDAGGSVTNLTNSGSISASVSGDKANALAVVDHGGGITSVLNTNSITASLNPAGPGEVVTGKAVALDLSANTTGVNLVQAQNNAAVAPQIKGDILLGNGRNSVSILSGIVQGSLSLGAASGDSLTIDNGATYIGALTYLGPAMTINVANGVLQDNSPTTINASSLNVGASSTLTVALDPLNNRSTLFNVSGAATFAPGAKIGATVLSTPSLGGQTFTIVKAGSLTTGNLSSAPLNLPYLFTGSLSSTANTIAITVATKTPVQLGMNKAESAAFNAIYAALPQDPQIQTAITGATSRASLISTYDQLLPNSSGDVFNTALGMSRAVSRAAADRFDTSTQTDDEEDDDFLVSGFWASEFYSGLEQNKADNNPYHSAALGVIGGYDFGGTGVTLSAASSNITIPHGVGDSLNAVSVVEGGAYAAPRFGAFSIDARLGAGWLHASDRRELVATAVSGDQSTTSTVARTAKGSWSGYDLTAHLGAGLQLDVSRHLFFQPRVYADVFHTHENAYAEHGSDVQGYGFNVSARDGTQTNGTASVVTGLRFGNQFVISPQLEVGYDKVITGGPGDTTARFLYGGPSFTVAANQISGAGMGRLTLRGDGNYVHFSLQAGGEYASNYHSLDLKAVFRLTF